MAYSSATLKKYADMTRQLLAEYRERVDHIDTCVSDGNVKIGRTLNVSLLAGHTCGNCKECLKYCYDIKACIRFPKNVLEARVKNTVLAMENRPKYFSDIRMKLKRRRKNKFMRWHVSGDIPDYEYFMNMVQIARDFPEFRFWTYTKMYHIVNEFCDKYGKEAIPENLSIMFSPWDGMEMVNPYGFGEFKTVMENEEPPKDMYHCPGNCDICKKLNRGCIANENTWNDLH